MDFSHSSEVTELAARTLNFVVEKIIPYEADPRWSSHGPTDELRLELNQLAREAGVFAPHAPKEFGGLGLGHLDRSFVFEAAGYSVLGPVALHCAAPDEGNTHLLDVVCNPAQRKAYLEPLARGERSCFCMTEPDGGAGADPLLMQTTAEFKDGHYVVNGRKWLITGAAGAAFAIIMAKNVGGPRDGDATMFLSPMDRPEIVIERQMDALDSSFPGGHCVVAFNDLKMTEDDVLGEVGEGFRYAQVRLAPARLTHCMRWLGAAQRAHDVAAKHATERMAFGQPLGRHEGVSFMLADNEIGMRSARLSMQQAAWLLDQGEDAGTESSMAKVQCSEVIWSTVDNSLQIMGGVGLCGETPIERIFREVRGFRIYDGPSEVHRWSLGRKIFKRAKTSNGAVK